jgi:hypothetical protein
VAAVHLLEAGTRDGARPGPERCGVKGFAVPGRAAWAWPDAGELVRVVERG